MGLAGKTGHQQPIIVQAMTLIQRKHPLGLMQEYQHPPLAKRTRPLAAVFNKLKRSDEVLAVMDEAIADPSATSLATHG